MIKVEIFYIQNLMIYPLLDTKRKKDIHFMIDN